MSNGRELLDRIEPHLKHLVAVFVEPPFTTQGYESVGDTRG